MGRFYVVCICVVVQSSGRTYVGFTNDVVRRLFEHNVRRNQGFTLRYRPWTLVVTEAFFPTKGEAMGRKFLKTGRGHEKGK